MRRVSCRVVTLFLRVLVACSLVAGLFLVVAATQPWMRLGIRLEQDDGGQPLRAEREQTGWEGPAAAGGRVSAGLGALAALLTLPLWLGWFRWAGPGRWFLYVGLALGLAAWFALHAYRLESYGVLVVHGNETIPARAVKLANRPWLLAALVAACGGALAALAGACLHHVTHRRPQEIAHDAGN